MTLYLLFEQLKAKKASIGICQRRAAYDRIVEYRSA